MKRIHRHLLFPSILLFCVSCATTAVVNPERDFDRFLSAWSGDYDNLAQVKQQEAAGMGPDKRNVALKLYIRRVDLPAFGEYVYYGEWRNARDESQVTRQRFYAFEIDPDEGKLRLNLHIWPLDKPGFRERTAGAWLDPAKLDGVTPADMLGLKGCDVYFEASGDGFAGAMKKGSCAFEAPGDGTPIYSWSQMKLTPTRFVYLDGWFNRDGTPYRRFTTEWYVFDKK